MIFLYLKEKKKVCLSFVFLLVWINILIIIDNGFTAISLLYLNISSLSFYLFLLLLNFFKEKKKWQTLYPQEMNFQRYHSYFDLFEKKQEALRLEMETFRNELRVDMLEQKDVQLSWIHEVKTPLTAMQLLINQLPNSHITSKLQVEWTRIYLLLDQTLHTLRLQEIEKDFLTATVSLKALVLPEIKDLQSWCFNKGIEINIEQLDFKVMTDEKWARFIVRQILANAVKYSKKNSTIDIEGSLNDEDQICLTITDYGIGIPSQDLPRIFQKGFTGTIGRKQSASTGMGLYLAHQAAQKLKLPLTATSSQLKTSFALIFPTQTSYSKIQSSREEETL